jgi:leucyl/phenylalanyl-tRNA--protein transferase
MWWSPDPRFVLFPQRLKISKSMKQLLKRKAFDFRINSDFEAVIHHCKKTPRADQDGTWITNDIVNAYTRLHEMGHVHSAEVWKDGTLVGGLYGVKMGKVFFGESMFSHETNTSKYAFISYVAQLMEEGIELIDCQVYTSHLESLGAEMIPRTEFIRLLQQYIP